MNKRYNQTLPDLLSEMVQRFGDRTFVIDHTSRRTYREFAADVMQAAKGLHALGVRRGDKVALLMGNQIEWLVIHFAVASLGAVLVPINTWWKRRELEHALHDSASSVLCMVDKYLNNDYVGTLNECGDLKALFPQLRQIVYLGQQAPAHGMPYAQMLAGGAAVPDSLITELASAVSPQDHAMYMFTSGSTARPKLAQLHHFGVIGNPYSIGERMHLTEHDRVLIPVSLFWAYACVNALFAAMSHGSSVVIQYNFSADEALRLIEAERCTAVYTLPNIMLSLYAQPDWKQRDLSSWRTGICRTQVLPLAVEMGARDAITSYGLTEGYGNSCTSDASWPLEVRLRGSGKPLPGTEIEIVDPKTHEPLAAGVAGEIRMRGFVTSGYFNDPVRTAEAIDQDGWFYTGDLAVFDELGILQFRSRIKELIKTGGINVTPADVEEALEEHPDVRQAIVVGVPDAQRDEIVAAMVVLQPGSSLTAAELLDHCKQSVATYKIPRHLQFVASHEVPLTDTGKVSKLLVQKQLTATYQAGSKA